MFVQGLLFRNATEYSYSIPVLLYISLMTNLKTSFYKKIRNFAISIFYFI